MKFCFKKLLIVFSKLQNNNNNNNNNEQIRFILFHFRLYILNFILLKINFNFL